MSGGLLEPKNALTIYKGESKTLVLTVEKPDPDNPGACIPVDLSGATVYFTVKEREDSTSVLIRKTSDSITEIEISDPYSGLARIFINPSDTLSLNTTRSYVFDVWVLLAGGERYPVVKPSTFRVLQGVTVI